MIGLVVATGLISGCENQGSGTATSSSAQADSLSQSAVQREEWLEIGYDDLRIREAASMKATVLATMKSGEQVKFLGETSPELERVELRGQLIVAPWGKVETKDGKQGWLFLGAVEPVKVPLAIAFKHSLNAISGQDCKVIQSALELYSDKMRGKSPAIADHAVPYLEGFIDSVVYRLNDELIQRSDYDAFGESMNEDGKSSKDPKIQHDIDAWKACGLHLEFPEGMCQIEADAGLVNPTVLPLVTPVMKQYLEQRKKEIGEGWTEDAGLMITPQQLAERAVFWDEFVASNPTFVYASRIRFLASAYMMGLIAGEDNTPSIDYGDTGTVLPEFKSAYEWVLKEHPKTETGRNVKEWMDILKASGWKRSPKVTAYINKLIS